MVGTFDENLCAVPLGKAALTEERVAFAARIALEIQDTPSKDFKTCSEREMMVRGKVEGKAYQHAEHHSEFRPRQDSPTQSRDSQIESTF